MAKLSLKEISAAMRHIDICMMTTKTGAGDLESRPMSNNREVDYNGDSYFFAYDHSSAAKELGITPDVNLAYTHEPAIIGKSMYISVTGKARLVHDREEMKKHWVKDVENWFKDGLDTPGLVMIHVKAARLKYWHQYEEGELIL